MECHAEERCDCPLLYPQHGLDLRRSLFQRIVLLGDLEPSTAASHTLANFYLNTKCGRTDMPYPMHGAQSDSWPCVGANSAGEALMVALPRNSMG